MEKITPKKQTRDNRPEVSTEHLHSAEQLAIPPANQSQCRGSHAAASGSQSR